MFATNLENNFEKFQLGYWLMIIVLAVLIILIIVLRDFLKHFKYEGHLRQIIGICLIIGLVSEQIWQIYSHKYRLSNSLPLSLCSISAFLSTWTILRKNRLAFDILFFTGIGGALIAILMANIKYTFPHITFINYYVKHILVVIVPIYMIAIHGFIPSLQSYKRMLATLLTLLPFILYINIVTGGNYWYLMKSLEKFRSFDFLGNYPYRIIIMIVISSIYSFFMLLPCFYFNKRRSLSKGNYTINPL